MKMGFLSDIEIAHSIKMKKISEIAKSADICEDYLEYYHAQDAKVYQCALNSVTSAYKLSIVRRR